MLMKTILALSVDTFHVGFASMQKGLLFCEIPLPSNLTTSHIFVLVLNRQNSLEQNPPS